MEGTVATKDPRGKYSRWTPGTNARYYLLSIYYASGPLHTRSHWLLPVRL